MNTIILQEAGKLEYKQIELDKGLESDEALLKVHRVGICGTDMHAFRGKQPFFSYPRILGHELGVEVVAVGADVTNVKAGDKCSVEPYFYKEEDQAPRRGKPNCAENISVFGVHADGGMREFIKLPAKYLHSSSKLTFDQLALVETLGIGCHAVNRANVQADDYVLVIGAGPIGLAAMQFAKIAGAKVAVMDINDGRLAFCKEQMKVDATINVLNTDPVAELEKVFGGDLPTVVMDATGNQQSMANTLEYAAHGARIVFIGLFQGDFTFFDPLFHKKELSLMASRNALSKDFDQIIEQMEAGLVDTTPWITHRVASENLVEEFESFLNPENGVIKAMIEFS
ncbi:zinc-binding alcohol dehydrogenase family protein [Flammeovirgaceae bacterium SG7u.111]|nr:zinc-binding alcohol dehydrogenase family protein [Flammeovirgaceae bacterium SG7u.132]WPO37615.1 zinc-binding alcohol dehydrogenase family protein [Flammeovirgaceae bacterium SG7u.111]